MILGIQVLGVLFGLFMLYVTFLHQKRNEFSIKEGVFWIVSWVFFIYVVVWPRSLDFIVKDILRVSRTFDFFIVLGFMFLIGITFYNYLVIRKTNKKIETLVRKIALDKK